MLEEMDQLYSWETTKNSWIALSYRLKQLLYFMIYFLFWIISMSIPIL